MTPPRIAPCGLTPKYHSYTKQNHVVKVYRGIAACASLSGTINRRLHYKTKKHVA